MSRLREWIRHIGIPRLLIAAFLGALLGTAVLVRMNLSLLLSDSLARVGRNGILVLAMLPAIQGGLGLNFGLPVGIVCGLVGCVTALNAGLRGIEGILASTLIGVLLAIPAGIGYGRLLNRIRGQEMMVGTYLGFAVVSMMSVFWLLAPFKNPTLVWAIGGRGLRTTLSLTGIYDRVIDNWLSFQVAGVRIPSGALIVFAGACLLLHWFFRTRMGISIAAARTNPRFALAAGISDERTRVQAAVLSTVLGAVGIVVYSQSFGFVQLYTAPLLMAFPAVACILIGGATVTRATIGHVVVGTVLFQSILTTALPVTSRVIEGDISETARLIIQNGMILYALTRLGDRS
ncbi:MAG TPA: ABC transporter permease [Candidatus Eisenbacteria bacterium]